MGILVCDSQYLKILDMKNNAMELLANAAWLSICGFALVSSFLLYTLYSPYRKTRKNKIYESVLFFIWWIFLIITFLIIYSGVAI